MGSNAEPKRIGVVVHADKMLGGGLEELRSALADIGHADPPWYEVSKSKKAPKAIRSMVKDDDVDRVLVWGGDGTVRRAINTIISDELDARNALPERRRRRRRSRPLVVGGLPDRARSPRPRRCNVGVGPATGGARCGSSRSAAGRRRRGPG